MPPPGPSPNASSRAATAATYDLVLLLDTETEQGARAGVVKEVKESISSSGELVRHDEWGNRELAYPIRHRQQAEYHLLQFHPADAELLRGLDRSLRIADEVLRFRIVRLNPGTPAPPDMRRGQAATEHAAAAGPRAPGEPAGTPAPDVGAEAGAAPQAEADEPPVQPTEADAAAGESA